MTIAINTFRTVASKANEANLLYIQDGKLKSTTAGKSGGSARNLYAGAADTPQATYGRVVVVLKEHVKRQCTYTLGDTFYLSTLKLKPEMRPAFEENLVAAFAGRLKDPAAALAELQSGKGGNAISQFMLEKKGNNWHGRTHATRSFVFSVAMANILREKGVDVDMNAVALGTAGHDTGRENNGRDTKDSEARSADIVNATVDQLYPGAAGEAWKGQVKASIRAKAANQTTLEGYLFKSADSLDYSRISDLEPKRFPFLREPIVTRDGLVVAADDSLRRQLMKEARLLAERTDPGAARGGEIKQFQTQLAKLSARRAPQNEMQVVQDLQKVVEDEIRAKETEQTETLSDAQVIDLVENAIRDNPQDFPLLAKYYLNADA